MSLQMYMFRDWMEILLYAVISLATIILGAVVSNYLKTRTNLKYKDELAEAADIATSYVSQIFVDKAKADGEFSTDDAHAEALQMALGKMRDILTASTMEFISKGKTAEEVTELLTVFIEDKVREHKLRFKEVNNGNGTTDH